MFTDLFRLASRFELSIPPEVATVLRALAPWKAPSAC